jgi:hypothetical protein
MQVRNTLLGVGFAVMAAGNWVFASQLTANMCGGCTQVANLAFQVPWNAPAAGICQNVGRFHMYMQCYPTN